MPTKNFLHLQTLQNKMQEVTVDSATYYFNANWLFCYLHWFTLNPQTIYYAALVSKYLICSQLIHQKFEFTWIFSFQLSNQNGSQSPSIAISFHFHFSSLWRSWECWLFCTAVPVCKMGIIFLSHIFALLNCWFVTGFYSLLEKNLNVSATGILFSHGDKCFSTLHR